MKRIPHSTLDDEPRFVVALSNLVQAGDLPNLPQWESSSKDEKAKLVRKKQSNKEAKEAEALAKELGVWDEFYGSGKTGARKGKGKAKKPADEDEDEGDTSALQALILKRQKDRNGFFDDLAAKYAGMEESSRKKGGRGKKRKKGADESEAEADSPKKKPHVQDPPDIDDEEFDKLQQKLFADKRKPSGEGSSAKGRRSGRTKKVK
jgi:DnaJ family protein C protein 9